MKTPSVRNLNILPFELPLEWSTLEPTEIIRRMEVWATENLTPRSAALGNYTRDHWKTKDPVGALGQFWIVRRNDYDTGRPRIEIQLRETVYDEIFVWNSQDDRLSMYKLLDSMLYEEYVRVGAELDWAKTFHLEYKHFSLETAPAAVREPELFDQCREMGKTLSAWLSSNLSIINNRGEEPTNPNPALSRFLKYNIVLYALAPEFFEQAKAYLNDPSVPDSRTQILHGTASKLREKLRRSNRLVTPEQLELHKRLKASCDYIEKLDPTERPIHISNLLGLQTRWLNEIKGPVQSFLK